MRIPLYQGSEMTEKIEWEVVDTPSPSARPTIWKLIKALLGPWWRWKVIGAAIIATLALLFFVTITGVIILVGVAGVVISIGIAKARRWLRRDGKSSALSNLE
jgi:hypothetical protein